MVVRMQNADTRMAPCGTLQAASRGSEQRPSRSAHLLPYPFLRAGGRACFPTPLHQRSRPTMRVNGGWLRATIPSRREARPTKWVGVCDICWPSVGSVESMFDDEPGWRLHPPAPRYAFSSGRKASPEPEAPGHGPEVPILAEPAPHGLLREPARGQAPATRDAYGRSCAVPG